MSHIYKWILPLRHKSYNSMLILLNLTIQAIQPSENSHSHEINMNNILLLYFFLFFSFFSKGYLINKTSYDQWHGEHHSNQTMLALHFRPSKIKILYVHFYCDTQSIIFKVESHHHHHQPDSIQRLILIGSVSN